MRMAGGWVPAVWTVRLAPAAAGAASVEGHAWQGGLSLIPGVEVAMPGHLQICTVEGMRDQVPQSPHLYTRSTPCPWRQSPLSVLDLTEAERDI